MQLTSIIAALMAVGTLAAPAVPVSDIVTAEVEVEADIAERAAPCTPGYKFFQGVCFRTYCNTRIFPSEADETVDVVPCTDIQQGIRKCKRLGDFCDYINFDSKKKMCTFIAEEGEGSGLQTGVPRYNAAARFDDFYCQ